MALHGTAWPGWARQAWARQAMSDQLSLDGQTTRTGTVSRVTFENSETGYRILRVNVEDSKGRVIGEETWLGSMPGIAAGQRASAVGRLEQDPKWGPQLKVSTVTPLLPTTIDGIQRYLGSGLLPGIGKGLAGRIVKRWGEQTLTVLEKTPERLREIRGLGPEKIALVTEALLEQKSVMQIMAFLQGHGAPPHLATRIFRRYREEAYDIVTQYPYRLAVEVEGVGFRTADKIALAIGIPADSADRAQAGTMHALHEAASKGHCYLSHEQLTEAASALLERDASAIDYAIRGLAGSGSVRIDGPAVFSARLHKAELRVTDRILTLMQAPASTGHEGALSVGRVGETVERAIKEFEGRVGFTLAPAQRDAVSYAANHKVLVVTGGPGVGKTAIVRALIGMLDLAKIPVRLAAPTGRAAKRMSEATEREAVTIHRLLEFDPRSHAFTRDRSRPIDAGAVVIDEASMLDVHLAGSCFDAVADGARLILVGDVDQLPSVGPGAVLRDVIDSDIVPTVRLTQIFRQAEGSEIVTEAHRINRGETPTSSASPTGEIFLFDRADPATAAELVVDLVVNRIPSGFGIPSSDIVVLTPMHRGEVGTQVLNEQLQTRLNPSGEELKRGTKVFRVGDKVMQLRNDYDRLTFNGDVGRVVAMQDGGLVVDMDGNRVEYAPKHLDELTLAYASSIHKSQGSEYPCVVIPVQMSAFLLLSRNLIYTAVTRAQRLCVLVAAPKALKLALGETRKELRNTLLKQRLRAEL